MLSDFCSKLKELSGSISGLIVGDLKAINHNIDPDGLRRALPIIITIAQAAGLPIVLFETNLARDPLSNHLADTIIRVEVEPVPLGPHEIVGILNSRSRDLIGINVRIPR